MKLPTRLDNSTENSVDGSETQSVIMDDSYHMDSLAVEIDSVVHFGKICISDPEIFIT